MPVFERAETVDATVIGIEYLVNYKRSNQNPRISHLAWNYEAGYTMPEFHISPVAHTNSRRLLMFRTKT
jgi:hypothetical protein